MGRVNSAFKDHLNWGMHATNLGKYCAILRECLLTRASFLLCEACYIIQKKYYNNYIIMDPPQRFLHDCSIIIIIIVITVQEAFEISEGIDGSAIVYTIMYIDALSGDIHNLTTIPASNCVHRMCQHIFKVSSKYIHFSDINITVFGTNVLGNGTRSSAMTIGMFSCYHKFQEKINLGCTC